LGDESTPPPCKTNRIHISKTSWRGSCASRQGGAENDSRGQVRPATCMRARLSVCRFLSKTCTGRPAVQRISLVAIVLYFSLALHCMHLSIHPSIPLFIALNDLLFLACQQNEKRKERGGTEMQRKEGREGSRSTHAVLVSMEAWKTTESLFFLAMKVTHSSTH